MRGLTRRARAGKLASMQRMASASFVAALLACDAAPIEVAVAPVTIEPASTRPARAEVVDPVLADRHPSLAYYPEVDAGLRAALTRRSGPSEILAALQSNLAPYRWPSMAEWDRHGFVDLHGDQPGFVSRIAGALVAQPPGRHDLGCAGGFLEGVRMTLLPELAIDDLDRCDEHAARVFGGATGCDPAREYGWLALTNIARRLHSEQLPAGPRLVEVSLWDEAAVARLAAPDAMHLCSVSHVAAARGGQRFYHHMMIVLGTPGGDALEVFDTTGARGVALARMSRSKLVRYCVTLLARHHEYRYAGRSTGLTCLPVVAR